MTANQRNSYKRYPKEYADDYQTYVDGNTVRKPEIQEEPRRPQGQRHRKRQAEALRRKKERLAAERASVFNFSFTLFVIFVVTVMVGSGIAAIKPVSDSMRLKMEIKALTADVMEAKKANDEFEIDLNNNIDLDYVRQVAKNAGLSYPKSGQKVYVESTDGDYCVLLVPLN